MILTQIPRSADASSRSAMTLMEVMVALGIGSMVLAIIAVATVFGARSFVALGNYSVLDQQSRLGVDQMTREIRQSTALLRTNASPKGLVFTNANTRTTVTYSWDPNTKLLTAKYSNEAAPRQILKNCDDWQFKIWQRTPYANQTNVFYSATNASLCKLVDMTWKCSRTVGGTKLLNTETIQTAQIVLRNQKSN